MNFFGDVIDILRNVLLNTCTCSRYPTGAVAPLWLTSWSSVWEADSSLQVKKFLDFMHFHYHIKVSAVALCAVQNLNIFLHSYQRNAPKSLCVTLVTVTTTGQALSPLYKVQASPLLAGHNFTQYIHAYAAYVEMSAGSGCISAQSMLILWWADWHWIRFF